MKTIWLLPGWFGLSFGPAPSGRTGRDAENRHIVLWNVMRQTVLVWNRRRATRKTLAQLDGRILADIGITPDQARMEAEKPFWLA